MRNWGRSTVSLRLERSCLLTMLTPLSGVALNVGVQVMNALMLPIAQGFLIALPVKAPAQAHRLPGATSGR